MGGIYNSTPVAKNHAIPNGETHYFEIPVSASPYLGIQIVWHDATSAFTGAVASTNQPPAEVAVNSTNAEHWSAEAGVAVPTVSAAAAGSNMIHLTGIGSRLLRLALTATANSRVSIHTHGKA
jgi:hypothetical protein